MRTTSIALERPTERVEPARTDAVRGSWADHIAIALVVLVSAGALAGFAVFTLQPQLLNEIPSAAAVYGRMFILGPRVQIAIAFAALTVLLARHVGVRWIGAFVAVYALSLASELAGTTVGLPFGPYRYTDGLGVKLFGHVPALIPLSWFFMALPSYAMAQRRFATRRQLRSRVLFGSLVLLSWDLALDPAMSLVTKYWIWGTEGPYYGMPLLNLVGWYVTGMVLMAALALLGADRWIRRLPLPWLIAFYGANLLLPVGMSLVAGLWGAVAATAAALTGCWLLARAQVVPERVEVGS